MVLGIAHAPVPTDRVRSPFTLPPTRRTVNHVAGGIEIVAVVAGIGVCGSDAQHKRQPDNNGAAQNRPRSNQIDLAIRRRYRAS